MNVLSKSAVPSEDKAFAKTPCLFKRNKEDDSIPLAMDFREEAPVPLLMKQQELVGSSHTTLEMSWSSSSSSSVEAWDDEDEEEQEEEEVVWKEEENEEATTPPLWTPKINPCTTRTATAGEYQPRRNFKQFTNQKMAATQEILNWKLVRDWHASHKELVHRQRQALRTLRSHARFMRRPLRGSFRSVGETAATTAASLSGKLMFTAILEKRDEEEESEQHDHEKTEEETRVGKVSLVATTGIQDSGESVSFPQLGYSTTMSDGSCWNDLDNNQLPVDYYATVIQERTRTQALACRMSPQSRTTPRRRLWLTTASSSDGKIKSDDNMAREPPALAC